MRIAMTAAPVLQNRLLAHSGREFDLWQACHESPEKSSKIVPLGAPLLFGVQPGHMSNRTY
jgi:hypothetical protein